MESLSLSLDVRGSVHHSTIHKEKSNKMQQGIKIYYSIYIYIYIYIYMCVCVCVCVCVCEAQHVSGDTPPIIRSLKL